MGIPAPLRTDGPLWTYNILAPGPIWGAGDITTNLNWGSQPGRPSVRVAIPPVKHTTVDGVATSRRALHAVRVFLHKEIVTGATRSTSGVLKDPPVINWKDVSGPIPVDKTLSEYPPEPLLIF